VDKAIHGKIQEGELRAKGYELADFTDACFLASNEDRLRK